MVTAPMVGRSAAHRELLEAIRKFAPIDTEVLITGPTGAGKEVCARLVHAFSSRSNGAFVPVNCGALPAELFENELFGHAGGAYTGAGANSEGLVVAAEHGTLFLDEIDTLSSASQVKLLRFIQHKEYRRLGEPRTRRADVRVITATNADLETAVKAKTFRADLFFRLKVLPLQVKPLEQRREDIPLMLDAYIDHYAELHQLERITFTPEARRRIESYSWPGNVRELENCVRYLTCLQLGRPVKPEDIPWFEAPETAHRDDLNLEELFGLPMREAKRKLITYFESRYLERALSQSGGNIGRAARSSLKPRRAFFELMRKYGLDKSKQALANAAGA